MGRKNENQGFICENCSEEVLPLTNGSYRNHCPLCLYSKHVDEIPGDRQNSCRGLMKPTSIRHKARKGLQIIHICLKCGAEKANIVAENTLQCDSVDEVVKLFY